MTRPEVPTPDEPEGQRRTAGVMLLIISVVALGYAGVLFVGGKALQDAPLSAPILKFKKGIENLTRSEPPRSLQELPPPLAAGLSPTPTPSPIVPRVSPSPSLSPTQVAPAPDAPSVVVFTIEYENTTGVMLTGVKITDDIPSGTSYRSGSATPSASFDGDTLVWDIGTLLPGERGSVSFQVSTRLRGRVTNVATLTSNEAPPARISSSAVVS